MKSACVLILLSMAAGSAFGKTAEAMANGAAGELLELEQVHAGEWIQLFVYRGEIVKAGQRLARQRNAQGKVVLEYFAASAGAVAIEGRVGLGAIDTRLLIETLERREDCRADDCEQVATH